MPTKTIIVLFCVIPIYFSGCTKKSVPITNVPDPVVPVPITPGVPELMFQSGFEGSSKVVPLNSIVGHDDDIIGVDNTLTGGHNDFGDPAFGSKFFIQYQGGDSTLRYAKIIPEPGNLSNKVLCYWLNDSYDENGVIKGRIQTNLYGISPGLKEFYLSVRVFLSNDFNALRSYSQPVTWLTISEFWNNEWWTANAKYGFRISLGIGKPTAATSDLNFTLTAENSGFVSIWKGNNTQFKVPIGKWFTMEYYFKEGSDVTGRFYLAVTPDGGSKQVVFDITNYTCCTNDPAPNGLTDYNPMKLYTSKEILAFMKSQGKTLQIYWDDFKLWKNKRP